MVVRGERGMQVWHFRTSDGRISVHMHSQHAAGTRTLRHRDRHRPSSLEVCKAPGQTRPGLARLLARG